MSRPGAVHVLRQRRFLLGPVDGRIGRGIDDDCRRMGRHRALHGLGVADVQLCGA